MKQTAAFVEAPEDSIIDGIEIKKGDKIWIRNMETTEQKPLTKHILYPGRVIGKWTLFEYSVLNHRGRWLCKCQCGNEVYVLDQSLKAGKTNSCGCTVDRHGESARQSSEYVSWQCMRARCLNPKNTEYKNYGGRGITVCERWAKYSNFLHDMGRAPEGKNTIDRINSYGNYEPDNCRWASVKEQIRNRRNTIFVEFNGHRRDLATWCELLGMEYNLVHHRQKYGRKISYQEQFKKHLWQTQQQRSR